LRFSGRFMVMRFTCGAGSSMRTQSVMSSPMAGAPVVRSWEHVASTGAEERVENCLACLTNLGDIHIFTVPALRPQVHYSCIRKEDISGIASCVFTKHGQGEGSAPHGLGVPHLCGSWEVPDALCPPALQVST